LICHYFDYDHFRCCAAAITFAAEIVSIRCRRRYALMLPAADFSIYYFDAVSPFIRLLLLRFR